MKKFVGFVFFGFLVAGCFGPALTELQSVPKDHPAQKFYQLASQSMLSDRICRDYKGNPDIPMGKINQGEGYTKLGEIAAGAFRFRDNKSGKRYLGISYLQYSGFLQLPKACVWEETESLAP